MPHYPHPTATFTCDILHDEGWSQSDPHRLSAFISSKSVFDVGNQVGRFFKPDVEPNQAMAITATIALKRKMRHDQAGNAAPAVSKLEEGKAINEPDDRFPRN